MKKVSIIVFISALVFGCRDSDNQPLDAADRLTQQAYTEMNRQNYEEAEHLLSESIDIHTETNDEAKLAENFSTLSSVQLLSGKLSPALESLTALRGIYRHVADRNAELQTMVQIGKIYFQLGRTDEAFAILTEAYNNSRLFRLEQISIISAIDLSTLYSRVEKHEKALVYSTYAYQLCRDQFNTPKLIEALSVRISSLAAMGNISKAFEAFREAESAALSENGINIPEFYATSGSAFARAEEWSFAKGNYERAIALVEQSQSVQRSPALIKAKIGLAELYFHHFAFAEAQQQFVQAYNLVKDGPDAVTKSYLLIRAADCLVKRSANIESQEGIIRAGQLYEQAQTLFSRNGFPFGEAITMHRLGMLKELSGDDNAAITFYKRAYDRFSEHTIDPNLFALPVNVTMLCRSESKERTPAEWFSANLLSLLLKYKRTNEAYAYLQSVRSISLQSRIFPLTLNFREPSKNNGYISLHNAVMMNQQCLLELHHLNMLNQQTKNRNYGNKLLQQIGYSRSKIQSDAVTLAQEFPAFSFFAVSHRTVQSSTLSSIPPSQAVLDYLIANNEAWVFIARSGEEITALKLTSSGYALENKMHRYCELLSSSAQQSGDLERLSGELFEILVRPIERSGIQRAVIIPPLQFDRFPFHMLDEYGVSLIEKTGISYLPHSALLTSPAVLPKFLNGIAAFGFTPNSRWGLEFELRDIRSFFMNAQVSINQTATRQKLSSAVGEVLQISSQFTIDADSEASFVLSDGSTSKAGVDVPVSVFTELHPFQIVYLSDVQSSANNIASLHALLWLLNGSTSVVAAQFPISPNVSKTFGENFYASLASDVNPFLAYRRAAVYLGKKKDLAGGFSGSAYFYYGVK